MGTLRKCLAEGDLPNTRWLTCLSYPATHRPEGKLENLLPHKPSTAH